jgi:hypothetical protein
VYYPAGVPVQLYGAGALLKCYNDCALYLETDAAATPAWWAKMGAKVRVDDAEAMYDIPSGLPYRVGKGAAIAGGVGAGAFREVAGRAGYFSRRLEFVALTTYPTDDDSAIWDRSWEPAGYANS